MKRVLVDLNLVLDVLLDRAPHADAAAALWACVEQHRSPCSTLAPRWV